MNDSPSKYAGLAAVFVLGTGLIIVGFNLPADHHARAVSMRWAGAFVLAFGLVAMVLQAGWINRALVVFVVTGIGAAVLAFSAARSEVTGRADYHHNFLMRHGWRTEPVTRQDKPEMFREATNARWALSILCVAASFGSFIYYRKTEHDDTDA